MTVGDTGVQLQIPLSSSVAGLATVLKLVAPNNAQSTLGLAIGASSISSSGRSYGPGQWVYRITEASDFLLPGDYQAQVVAMGTGLFLSSRPFFISVDPRVF